MMRVVGSAEPPGGKPTMKRIGFDGYWASADPAQSNSARARAAFEGVFMALSPAATLNPSYGNIIHPPISSRAKRRKDESSSCCAVRPDRGVPGRRDRSEFGRRPGQGVHGEDESTAR